METVDVTSTLQPFRGLTGSTSTKVTGSLRKSPMPGERPVRMLLQRAFCWWMWMGIGTWIYLSMVWGRGPGYG